MAICDTMRSMLLSQRQLIFRRDGASSEDELLIATHELNQSRSAVNQHLANCDQCTWIQEAA